MIPRTRSLSNESIEPNVKFNFFFDVNDNLCFGVLPEEPNRAVIKGAGAAGLVYPGAARALLETYKLKSIAGASAGACTAVYIALGFSMDEFEKISRNKDLSTIEELKHYNEIKYDNKTQETKSNFFNNTKKACLKPLNPTFLDMFANVGKKAYKVGKTTSNLLSKKHGIYSGKKIAEEVNTDICEHTKKKIYRILSDITDEQQLQKTIEQLQLKGPLKEYKNGTVTLKTFEDVLMNDHLACILEKISSEKKREEILNILKNGSLKNKTQRLLAMKRIKSLLHPELEKNLIKEFENFVDEFIHFSYLLDNEVLTFGQFKYLLKHYQQYDFRCALYIEVANRTTKQTEFISHETDPHLPIGIATQMSMSIPVVFKRVKYKGCYYEDGGVQSNCPLQVFDGEKFHPLKGESGQNLRTIGLYRANPAEMKILHTTPPKEKSSKAMNMITSVDFRQTNYQNKVQVHNQFPHRTVLIPDLVKTGKKIKKGKELVEEEKPFSSLNFKATQAEKDQLIHNGYTAFKQHTENYAEGAICSLKFSSVEDLKHRQADTLQNLQDKGACLPANFNLLKLLEQKLADKKIPTDLFFPRGPSTRQEREWKRQRCLAKVRDALQNKPKKRIKFVYTEEVLPKPHATHYKIRRV